MNYIERKSEEVGKKLKGQIGNKKRKLFKKPKKKHQMKTISSSKLMKSFASTHYQGIKEVPEKPYGNDNRSLFFQKEWESERRKMIK